MEVFCSELQSSNAKSGAPAAAPAGAHDALAPRAEAALELVDLACERGERMLFQGVEARVLPGQMLRVLGRNGAGKTSLLRIVCGLVAPQRGTVHWRGFPIEAQRETFHRELVYLGHGAALKEQLSATENLQTACGIQGVALGPADARAALAEAGLQGCDDLPVQLLSQGQRRRAALARLAVPSGALSGGQGEPARRGLWVLDEPFNALDRAASAWLLGRIRQHAAGGGVVVLTSHQDVSLGAGLEQVVVTL